MAEIIKQDITSVTHGTIAHQVNCQGAMGAGVAKVISNKHPKVRQDYLSLCEKTSPEDLFGRYQVVHIAETDVDVVNIFSQLTYGNAYKTGKVYTDVDKLVAVLKHICNDPHLQKPIHIPFGIGCGLAGASWAELFAKIKDLPLIICKLTS